MNGRPVERVRQGWRTLDFQAKQECVAQEGQAWTIECSGNAERDGREIDQDAKPDCSKNRIGQSVLVALTSDVRKVNLAWDHSRPGAAIEEVVHSRQALKVRDTGSAGEIRESVKGAWKWGRLWPINGSVPRRARRD